MSKPETQVDYYVIYQQPDNADWYTFTNTRDLFQHARENGPYNSTTDLAEAEAAARGLMDRTVFTDSRPKYQYPIAAARVVQLVHVGTDVVTYGTPQGE